MWKLIALALVIGFNVHAETVGNSHLSGHEPDSEEQDAEPYAVSPGNPSEGDDPAACLSADTVKRYEKKAQVATKKIVGIATKSPKKALSLQNVRQALQEGELIPSDSGPLAARSALAGPGLQKHKFVNLLGCKEWRDKIKGGSGQIPLGAVLIYEGGPYGDSRIKTPEGCIGANASSKTCRPTNRKLIGVYVQIAN